jgi:DNA-binding CsgD family transcriptional regulator
VSETPGVAPVEVEQASHLLALLGSRTGTTLDSQEWSERIAGHLQLSFDPRYAPQAPARVEAAFLRGNVAGAAGIAREVLGDALASGERWCAGALACWLRRAGEPAMVDLDRVAPPHRHELEGDARGAADAWAALGCRYEQGLALFFADDTAAVQDALAIFAALGAKPASGLARQKLRARGVHELPRGRYAAARGDPQGLTARERTVFELLRKGLSNRAIADHLRRSERTVEHHVSSLLAKLGAASRADLDVRRRYEE